MGVIFDRMWNKLPDALKSDFTEGYYKAFESIVYDYKSYMTTLENIHVLDYAVGEELDKLGEGFGVNREGNQDDDLYRKRIKIVSHSIYFVPNLNNLMFFIKSISGKYPQELTLNPDGEPATIKAGIIFGNIDDLELMQEIDDKYSAGARLDYYFGIIAQSKHKGIGSYNKMGLPGLNKIIIDRFYGEEV